MKKILIFLNLITKIISDNCEYYKIWCDKSQSCINIFENCECLNINCDNNCNIGYLKDHNNCNTCECIQHCPLTYNKLNNYLSPKITQISSCSIDKLEGYNTYQISLILNNDYLNNNIYAIFGDESNGPLPMIIPPSYQIEGVFGSNLGGVSDSILKLNPDSMYDSWLTIGIVDGDLDDKISSIGIDFDEWTNINGLNILNGAVFLMNPNEKIININEYIIGQFTILNNDNLNVILNAQGKNLLTNEAWSQYNIEFNLNNNNLIPNNCKIWFDGCNSCMIINNNINSCTSKECDTFNIPHCLINYESH